MLCCCRFGVVSALLLHKNVASSYTLVGHSTAPSIVVYGPSVQLDTKLRYALHNIKDPVLSFPVEDGYIHHTLYLANHNKGVLAATSFSYGP